MPIKNFKVAAAILYLMSTNSYAALQANSKLQTTAPTTREKISNKSIEHLLSNFKTASNKLHDACCECDNYTSISKIMDEIESLAETFITTSSYAANKPQLIFKTKAKLYQLTNALTENYHIKLVLQFGNYHRYLASIFQWQKKEWNKLLKKYHTKCFTVYLKHNIEGPLISAAKILSGFLVLVKFAVLFAHPNKLFKHGSINQEGHSKE